MLSSSVFRRKRSRANASSASFRLVTSQNRICNTYDVASPIAQRSLDTFDPKPLAIVRFVFLGVLQNRAHFNDAYILAPMSVRQFGGEQVVIRLAHYFVKLLAI